MKTTVPVESLSGSLETLRSANAAIAGIYPGESPARQPVHTVYGGAHLFKHDTARRLGELALRSLREFGPDFAIFARAIGLRGCGSLPEGSAAAARAAERIRRDPAAARDLHEPAALAHAVYERVMEKLSREPVEDFRIDFEDGYGNRPDADEDACAVEAATAVARGMAERTLPPFIGIRIKTMSAELHRRGLRTLDLFLTALLERSGGRLPENFVITIPKVVAAEQVSIVIDLLEAIESRRSLARGTLRVELMVETTQSIIGSDGRCPLPMFVAAARGRCVACHFGVYDYTACCTITAAHQHMRHPACDFARHAMQVALAGTGVWISDGATNIMPIVRHRAAEGGALSADQAAENLAGVHRAWRLHFDDVRHSLMHAYYQGWDLHPAQLPTRYAAVFAFYLEGLQPAAERLRNFVEKAALATLAGDVFDDAATGQGLLNFFLRGVNCGAISEHEALACGLSLEELRTRSFVKIMERRRKA